MPSATANAAVAVPERKRCFMIEPAASGSTDDVCLPSALLEPGTTETFSEHAVATASRAIERHACDRAISRAPDATLAAPARVVLGRGEQRLGQR
jgi:hypothetical protein